MSVSKIPPPLKNIGDLMEANADLMTQVYHDEGLSADEKLRSFSLGIRNQCSLSRDLQNRRAELARYNLLHQTKAEDLSALRFIPAPPDTAAVVSLPAPAVPDGTGATQATSGPEPGPAHATSANHDASPRLN